MFCLIMLWFFWTLPAAPAIWRFKREVRWHQEKTMGKPRKARVRNICYKILEKTQYLMNTLYLYTFQLKKKNFWIYRVGDSVRLLPQSGRRWEKITKSNTIHRHTDWWTDKNHLMMSKCCPYFKGTDYHFFTKFSVN